VITIQQTLFSKPTKPPAPKQAPVKKVDSIIKSLENKRQDMTLFSDSEYDIATLILMRRHHMLIHSCIYYELNKNLISDAKFDELAMELVDLQAKYPSIAERVIFHEVFIGWDGTTGHHLPLKTDWILHRAEHVVGLGKAR